MTDRYPDEVEAWHEAIGRLRGVRDVCSGIQSVWGIKGEHLSLVDFGQLPHAAYRRTDGGLENETLVQTEFRLLPKPYSWRSLEFLAWWVRDQARGGELIQLRPFGLPPIAGFNVQLGGTLRFHIDIFRLGGSEGETAEVHLPKIREYADDLVQSIDLYEPTLLEKGQARITRRRGGK
jgi:hypothetical protein